MGDSTRGRDKTSTVGAPLQSHRHQRQRPPPPKDCALIRTSLLSGTGLGPHSLPLFFPPSPARRPWPERVVWRFNAKAGAECRSRTALDYRCGDVGRGVEEHTVKSKNTALWRPFWVSRELLLGLLLRATIPHGAQLSTAQRRPPPLRKPLAVRSGQVRARLRTVTASHPKGWLGVRTPPRRFCVCVTRPVYNWEGIIGCCTTIKP